VVLAKSGVSTVPASAVTGDIGVSPAAATYVTGTKTAATLATGASIKGRLLAQTAVTLDASTVVAP
jgi:hypothetical protein